MNTPRENDDCQTLAPFVMALFDGEADELQAQRARAHLLVCQMCARRWLDWNRSRDLLRAIPVPAPPPTLLWRVLMACRLAAFARKRRFNLSDSLGLAAPQGKKTGSEFAPRDLSAQILARTTRVEAVPSREPRRRVFPISALPSLAVPALAIWLIALQNNALWLAPSPETPLPDAAPPIAATPRRAASVSSSPATPRRRAVSLPQKFALNPPAALTPAPRRTAATSVQAAPAPMETPERETEAPPVAPRAVTVALAPTSPRPAAATPARSVPALQVTPPQPRVLASTPQLLGSPRLTVLSTSKNTPQLRTARWKTSAPRLVAAVEKAAPGALPSRVSPPTAPAPAPAPPLRLAENFEADDEGVEEMRSVVDDFRAALDPDGFQTIDFDAG